MIISRQSSPICQKCLAKLLKQVVATTYVLCCKKTNLWTCATSEDSRQPAHPCSLQRICYLYSIKLSRIWLGCMVACISKVLDSEIQVTPTYIYFEVNHMDRPTHILKSIIWSHVTNIPKYEVSPSNRPQDIKTMKKGSP